MINPPEGLNKGVDFVYKYLRVKIENVCESQIHNLTNSPNTKFR